MTSTSPAPALAPTAHEADATDQIDLGLDLDLLRRTARDGTTYDLAWRRAQLAALRDLVVEHEDEITEAITADVGKPALEVRLTETSAVVQEIDHLLAHLEEWTAPRTVPVPAVMRPATAEVQLQPKGVVLVIAPWNYPLQLLLSPLAGALAAGNTAVLKPSETVPRVAALVERLVPQHLGREVVQVVTGGVPETTALLAERFDHIVFTGSTRVGRIVMRAAAEHLTPVTLELGGRSPAFVDGTMDLQVVARRLAWGKFTNAGQTCIAPDHVLVTPEAREPLVEALRAAVEEFFGPDPQRSGDLGRVVDAGQHARLVGLLDGHGGQVVIGGQHDAADRFFVAPTVIVDPAPDSAVLGEEIFGPILPLVTVADVEEATALVRAGEHPLALYVFSDDPAVRAAFTTGTTSGGMTIGAPLLHIAAPGLPFGGVGSSGMGAYHGRASIEELSHHRSVLTKPATPDTLRVVYPPHPAWKQSAIRRVLMPLRRPDVLAPVRRILRRG
ncbi:aldehyde dehydrogenase family protein [Ornithinimicrobium humiphilum]|uniref:Aldehyde dehydrogenase n=1 Tax=Ornithinimicrobium humiphilum TaxID=125288 RepID=A0A543KQK1_9MICO|nr:aldehyde dehydrogenase family protein [Ornithinimicrobium humiphilum]TQM97352.1 aldehyde dehydrogenase (NAD+) [Ornithinimicrobium humiphilum]